jgi:feruloyl esterase
MIRLFMAPGMQHCGGGPGPNQINWMAALERWRESGIAPNQVEAVHIAEQPRRHDATPVRVSAAGRLQRDREHNDAQNFVCK